MPKSRLLRIREKAAQFKLNWQPVRDVIDRVDKITEVLFNAGIALYGYRVNDHWTGALTALLGYRLAKAENLVAGTTGVGILTAMGVLSLTKPFWAHRPIWVP